MCKILWYFLKEYIFILPFLTQKWCTDGLFEKNEQVIVELGTILCEYGNINPHELQLKDILTKQVICKLEQNHKKSARK